MSSDQVLLQANETVAEHSDAPVVVSIIINNYNYAHFLPDAIESALDQTYPHVEVIVVDDGSTDESPEIIQGYDDRVTALLKQNGGQASAFNAGFGHSTGDVVVFLDSDDRLSPDIAGTIAAQFKEQPDTALIMYRLEVIDAEGKSTGILKPEEHLPRRSGDLRRHVLNFPFDMVRMATSGNAFSARVLREIMPIPEDDYPGASADWYLNYVSPLFGEVRFLDEVGGYYRVHGSNNFELASPELSLTFVRNVIANGRHTGRHIQEHARRLGLIQSRRNREVLSVSFVAYRILSLKMEPEQHPVAADSLGKLLISGLRASHRRFDVAWPMRVMFATWFLTAVIAPRRITHWLALKLSFPATRGRFNSILARLHRSRPS